jgi:lysophospholipase L1-like esterase
MTGSRVFRGVLKSLLTTIIFFAIAELGLRGAYFARNSMVRRVPLPYSVGDEYGPIPPWLDRLMILVPDDMLIWRNLPNVRRTYVDIFSPARTAQDRTALLRRFVPTLPAEFRDNPTWSIALNAEGYRSREFSPVKPPSTIRIACVGDSWTFGMNVDQDRSYPSRLEAWLQQTRPDTKFEVLNFGVLGYSSFQGLQLLKTRVLDLHPDLVAIGFGMNDSEVAGYRDKDMIGGAPPRWTTRLRDVAKDFEFYKLLNYLVLTLKFHPKSVGDYMREQAATKGSGRVDYDTIEPWTRVSPQDYERNIREMVGLARAQGARVVLLDNELWADSPYRPILKVIAADSRAPLVDSLKMVTDAATKMASDLEAQLGLTAARLDPPGPPDAPGSLDPRDPPGPPGPPDPPVLTEVVFRVSHGDVPVSKAVSIVGTDPQLGNVAPNTVAMHDDGRGGDERAGDGVWSLATKLAPGTRVFYVYTNSGGRGQWEGLDVPHIRSVLVPASVGGRPVYLPIETFGRLYMQADDWHTDAVGYDLIARAVAEAISGPR